MKTVITAEFLAELGGAGEWDRALPAAQGISFNSERTRSGDAFFALPGASGHGMDYADEALSRGAVFLVSDRPHPKGIQVKDPVRTLLELGRYARAQLQGPVVGITGSAGKTSTKTMAAAAINATSTPGNFNTPYALAQVLVDSWLAGKTGVDARLVLELGIDHIGEMELLVSLARPTHGLLTLVSPSHLAGLNDLETVAREKGKLLAASEVALVSSEAAPFVKDLLRTDTLIYGLEGDPLATYRGRVVGADAQGQTLEFHEQQLRLPYPGAAMARNAVAALVLAELLELDLKAAAARLAAARLEPSRLQISRLEVPSGPLTLIDDSYNSNPASAEMALEVLRQSPAPHTAILGDMLELGARSEELHRELGRESRGLDHVFGVGPEARFIIEENPVAQHYPTVEALLEALEAETLEGTVLIKASRGMKLERVVEAIKRRAKPKRPEPDRSAQGALS